MIFITRKMKVLLITVLALLMVVTIVMSGLVIVAPTGGIFTNISRFSTFNIPFAGYGNSLYERSISASYPINPKETLYFSTPIGNVHIQQGTSQQVHVQIRAEFGGSSLQSAKNQAAALQIQNSHLPGAVQLSLVGLNGPMYLRKADIAIVVPKGVGIHIKNSLGNLNVFGNYPSVTVHAGMGNMTLNGSVQGTTDLHDNMGQITYQGVLGTHSILEDDMGNIDLSLFSTHPQRINASTDLGNISGQIGNVEIHSHHNWTGIIGKVQTNRPAGLVEITNHMGDITINGVNQG